MSGALLDRLLDSRARAARLAVPEACKPADLAAAYALQRRMAERLGALPPAGFKIGATAEAMRAYLGLEAPLAGFVRAEDLGPRHRFAAFRRPGVECEIALRLSADLAPRPTTREEAAAAVGAAMAAIEIVDDRYGDLRALGVPLLAADRVFHAAGSLGPERADWRRLGLADLRGELRVDGVLRGEGTGAALMGDPLAALAWLAGSACAAAFGGLRAGQVVFLGSVCTPVWLEGPCRVCVRFEGLGEVSAEFA
ncbi:MAG: fumarylacetoacetate hydrolase family protein [Acetobacteraceae bacterium]|nr:fumarylacetoacetate hydrolase family protein [Acetobacteraceae bacterium]